MEVLDIKRLRDITAGNQEIEQELFRLFDQTANRCLGNLEKSISDVEAWKQAAHELKGAAANMGALKLLEISKKAEVLFDLSQNEKNVMIESIRDAIEEFKQFKNQLYKQ